MRGAFVDQGGLFSYIAPEARVPANHPLRKIRELVRDVLGELNRSLVSVAKRLGLGYRSKLCRWIGHKMRESAGTGKLGTDDFWVGLDIARRLSA